MSRSTDLALLTNYGTTRNKSASSVSWTVYGQLVSLKNRRRLLKSRKTGKLFPAKSGEAEKYARDFYWQVPVDYRDLQLGSLKSPLRLIVTVYYRTRRSDLDVGLLLDCLQLAGVIRNDRFVIEQHLYAAVDRNNPRVELTLEFI